MEVLVVLPHFGHMVDWNRGCYFTLHITKYDKASVCPMRPTNHYDKESVCPMRPPKNYEQSKCLPHEAPKPL